MVRLVEMIEKGNLKMDNSAGIKTIGKYGLDKINEAM